MKKVIKLVLCLVVSCFIITGCSSNKVQAEFITDDLDRIEIFHYSTPEDAQKMVITSKEDIKNVLDATLSLSVKSSARKSEIPDGADTTILRFVLKDESMCTTIYYSVKPKLGILSLTSREHYSVLGKKVHELWGILECEKESISEEDVPKLK